MYNLEYCICMYDDDMQCLSLIKYLFCFCSLQPMKFQVNSHYILWEMNITTEHQSRVSTPRSELDTERNLCFKNIVEEDVNDCTEKINVFVLRNPLRSY